MSAEELAGLVFRMRQSQKQYSQTRGPMALVESRDWEQRVDQAVLEIREGPRPTLFSGRPE